MQRRTNKRWGVVVVSLFVVAMMVGCTQSPENSPVIRKLMSDISTLQDEIADAKDQIRRMSADVEALNEEMGNLSQRPAGQSAVDAKEIERLTGQINELTKKLSSLEKSLATVKQQASSSRSVVSSSPPPEPSPEVTTTSKTDEEEPRVEPKGFYYTIQKGDTLEGISRKFNVSQAAIRRENRIREDGTIFAGVRLFIPGKRPE